MRDGAGFSASEDSETDAFSGQTAEADISDVSGNAVVRHTDV